MNLDDGGWWWMVVDGGGWWWMVGRWPMGHWPMGHRPMGRKTIGRWPMGHRPTAVGRPPPQFQFWYARISKKYVFSMFEVHVLNKKINLFINKVQNSI